MRPLRQPNSSWRLTKDLFTLFNQPNFSQCPHCTTLTNAIFSRLTQHTHQRPSHSSILSFVVFPTGSGKISKVMSRERMRLIVRTRSLSYPVPFFSWYYSSLLSVHAALRLFFGLWSLRYFLGDRSAVFLVIQESLSSFRCSHPLVVLSY